MHIAVWFEEHNGSHGRSQFTHHLAPAARGEPRAEHADDNISTTNCLFHTVLGLKRQASGKVYTESTCALDGPFLATLDAHQEPKEVSKFHVGRFPFARHACDETKWIVPSNLIRSHQNSQKLPGRQDEDTALPVKTVDQVK